MYRTEGKWESAYRSFNLITGGLPDKLVYEDVDLATMKDIITLNREANHTRYNVSTECKVDYSTKHWDIFITDYQRFGNSYNISYYRLCRNQRYNNNDNGELNVININFMSYCSSSNEKRICTFEKKEDHIIKTITYTNNDTQTKKIFKYDYEGNIIKADVKTKAKVSV